MNIAEAIADEQAEYTFVSPEVVFAPDKVMFSDRLDVKYLKTLAEASPRRRTRLCTHTSVDAPVHEMLILHHRDVYVPPHRHVGKPESFHIVEGEASVMFFDDDGAITRVVEMGASGSGKPFYYRIPQLIWHAFIIRSEWLVFREVTQGPFHVDQKVIAPFAAPSGDDVAIGNYLADLELRAAALAARES